MGDNFIAAAIKKPGALHAQLGVPQGQTIPAQMLATAAQQGGKLGQRARFAQTLEGLPHKKKKRYPANALAKAAAGKGSA